MSSGAWRTHFVVVGCRMGRGRAIAGHGSEIFFHGPRSSSSLCPTDRMARDEFMASAGGGKCTTAANRSADCLSANVYGAEKRALCGDEKPLRINRALRAQLPDMTNVFATFEGEQRAALQVVSRTGRSPARQGGPCIAASVHRKIRGTTRPGGIRKAWAAQRRGTVAMARTAVLLTCAGVGAGVLLLPRHADALGPMGVEVGGQVGAGTNPVGGGSLNPLGL